jgi:predicted site-specific integrase-resolvase
MQRLDENLIVTEAARVHGISASTLRNLNRVGKLEAIRHSIIRYRLIQYRQTISTSEEIGFKMNDISRSRTIYFFLNSAG